LLVLVLAIAVGKEIKRKWCGLFLILIPQTWRRISALSVDGADPGS
jgi:hypothetical protein